MLKKVALLTVFLASMTTASFAYFRISISYKAFGGIGSGSCWFPGGDCQRTFTFTWNSSAIAQAFADANITVPDGYVAGLATDGISDGEFGTTIPAVTLPSEASSDGNEVDIPEQTAVWSSSLGGYLIYFKESSPK